MAKQIVYAEEAREKMKAGIDKLAKAVVTTLGPKGRNVAIDKKWGAPTVLHDGVSVAKEIELEDPFENMGAQLAKELKEADWQSVATISAQNPEVGAKIAEALKLVGKDGVIEVEEGKGLELEIEHKEGMAFDK